MKIGMNIMPLQISTSQYFSILCHQQYQHGFHTCSFGGNNTSISHGILTFFIVYLHEIFWCDDKCEPLWLVKWSFFMFTSSTNSIWTCKVLALRKLKCFMPVTYPFWTLFTIAYNLYCRPYFTSLPPNLVTLWEKEGAA